MRLTSPLATTTRGCTASGDAVVRSPDHPSLRADASRPTPSGHRINHDATVSRGTWRPGTRTVVIITATALASLVCAGNAQAETTHVLALAASVNDVFNNIRNWLVGILAGLATVFLTVGGVRYLMASGDPGEVEKAKQAFKSAGWGYGLAALAPLVVEILKQIVGA